ncbi:MAG: hypothetical protein L0229_21695 [Blastocatellia bacterium]|nr:hypothetical protein [Blastocatellia bacterium]
MFKSVFSSLLILSLITMVGAGQKPVIRGEEGFVSPSELNVRIAPDVRTFVVMAALNVAGFDYETGGQELSPARAELRRDLANLDPAIKAKLAAFYKSHRRPNVEEAADAGRYAALSLLMNQPPDFRISERIQDDVPEDLLPLMEFIPLVQEFYLKGGLRELAPKYTAVGETYAVAYRRPVGEVIFQMLDYFRTIPETIVNMRPFVVSSGGEKSGKKEKAKVIERTRTRQVFIIHDPLSAIDTSFLRGDILNQKEDLLVRRVGDDYNVIIGPSVLPNLSGIRQTMIRFVIDPLVERHLKESLKYKDEIVKLVETIESASKEYRSSVYLVIRESLAQAAGARMRLIEARRAGAYKEDDAVFDLAQAYRGGAALVFHFYEALAGLEQVGISIEDFFDEMVATTKFEKEATRPASFEPVVARVEAARREAASKPSRALSPLAEKILLSDDHIRNRRFAEARPVLEEILAADPRNARALYGLAQVLNLSPSAVEQDPQADEDDKIQAQYDRLNRALKLYDSAIENASPQSEAWLIQWGHVLKGRILDFQEFRGDAIAEYEKALKMGDNIPNGAYKEALEGKERPYTQKRSGG